LLERGNDWYVQGVTPDASALSTPEFNGVLASWKEKMLLRPKQSIAPRATSELTVSELLAGLKPGQLWTLVVGLCTLLGVAFAAGKFFGVYF